MSGLVVSFSQGALKKGSQKVLIEHNGEILEVEMILKKALLKVRFSGPQSFQVQRDRAKDKKPKARGDV